MLSLLRVSPLRLRDTDSWPQCVRTASIAQSQEPQISSAHSIYSQLHQAKLHHISCPVLRGGWCTWPQSALTCYRRLQSQEIAISWDWAVGPGMERLLWRWKGWGFCAELQIWLIEHQSQHIVCTWTPERDSLSKVHSLSVEFLRMIGDDYQDM